MEYNMVVIVNGQKKELTYICNTNCDSDITMDIIGMYDSFPVDDEGNLKMSISDFEWWSDELDKLTKIDDMLEDVQLSDEDFDRYINDTNMCDLEAQTDAQLEWLQNYVKG